jgi:hypothetical protein
MQETIISMQPAGKPSHLPHDFSDLTLTNHIQFALSVSLNSPDARR